MKRIFKENGLSIVCLGLFFVAFVFGQAWSGHLVANEERIEHGQPPESFATYLAGAHFMEATMENWESEFLQMGLFVFLTTFLYQKGSAESKSLTEREEVDRSPHPRSAKKDAPWPVRQGGWVLRVYENSLTLAFLALFLATLFLHAVSGRSQYNEEQILHGQPPVSLARFLGSSQFWFESFQNWQSEFLAIGAMVILTIFLRQKGSPESKPVDAPHSKTGK